MASFQQANTFIKRLLAATCMTILCLSPFDTTSRGIGTSVAASPLTTTPTDTLVAVDFAGMDADDERVDTALAHFAAAGLSLGHLELDMSTDPAACNGNSGIHRFGATHAVVICNTNERLRQRTLLHELAHVWAARNLDESARADFMASRGLTAWGGPALAWEARGTEHAAEIIAWGISDHSCWVLPRAAIGSRDIETLTDQFEQLTGTAPRCDAEAPRPDDERVRKLIG